MSNTTTKTESFPGQGNKLNEVDNIETRDTTDKHVLSAGEIEEMAATPDGNHDGVQQTLSNSNITTGDGGSGSKARGGDVGVSKVKNINFEGGDTYNAPIAGGIVGGRNNRNILNNHYTGQAH